MCIEFAYNVLNGRKARLALLVNVHALLGGCAGGLYDVGALWHVVDTLEGEVVAEILVDGIVLSEVGWRGSLEGLLEQGSRRRHGGGRECTSAIALAGGCGRVRGVYVLV